MALDLRKKNGFLAISFENICVLDSYFIYRYIIIKYSSTKEGKDQESIQLSTTPDPGYQWKSDNVTKKHHKREPTGQRFPSR